MEATKAEWCETLAPWLDVLRLHSLHAQLPPLPTLSDLQQLRFCLEAPSQERNTPEVWMWLAEAVELLDLLARVDHLAAWYLLLQAVDTEEIVDQYGEYLFESPDLLPRFSILVEDEVLLEPGQVTTFGLLRFVVKSSKVSEEYEDVKQALLDEYAVTHNGEAFDRETHGRVSVALVFDVAMDFGNDSANLYVFKQIRDVISIHRNPAAMLPGMGPDSDASDDEEDDDKRDEDDQGKRVRERGAFTFDGYRIDLSSESVVSNLVLYLLNEISSVGLPCSRFSITNVAHSQLHHSVLGNFFINQVVPWAGCREKLGIEDLELNLGMFDAAAVRAFCSAIVCSRSLRKFTFNQAYGDLPNPHGDVAGIEIWWPWLAYALFSRDATHQIQSVAINMHDFSSLAIIDSIKAILNSNDPAVILWLPSEDTHMDSTDGVPVAAALNKTAQLRLGFRSQYNADAEPVAPGLTIGEPGVTYQVLRNRLDEDFIEFILPGSGVAWTERKELINLEPLSRRVGHSIRHLTLMRVEEEEIQRTVELLELIGKPLERVSITGSGFSNLDLLLGGIVRFCPNLKRLDLLDARFESFDWLCRPRHDAPGLRLESLTIHFYTRDALDWSPLFDALSEPTHPLSKSLREISIRSRRTHNHPAHAAHNEMVRKYIDMMENNMRLERCELTSHLQPTIDEFYTRFHANHLKFISAVEAPMSAAQTLAFLSVTTPSMETTPQQSPTKRSTSTRSRTMPVRHRLGPEMIRSVLEFAATPKRRLCTMASQVSRQEQRFQEWNDGENGQDGAVDDLLLADAQ